MTKTRIARYAVALIGVGLIGIGPVALVAPEAGAELFGIPSRSAEAHAYLWAAATRDVAIGGMLLALLALGVRERVLGACVAVVGLIPIGDALNVYRHAGLDAMPALAVHVGSIVFLGVLAAWLWRHDGDR